MISLRALGLLRELAELDSVPPAEVLATQFKEGRDAIRTALKELNKNGYIRTYRAKAGSRYMTTTRVTSAGFQRLESRLLTPQSQQNSNMSHIPIHTETVTNSSTGSMREDEDMGYEFFGKTSSMDTEERYAEAHKAREKAKARFQSEKASAMADKKQRREERPKETWSCLDVAYEFADKTQDHWHIPPWSVNKSRFVQALGNMRKLHNTDGAIECEAIDWFFKSISIDKYNSGEHLWKMFIKQFPGLVDEIKNMVRADEEVSEESLLRTAKALSLLED